MVQYAAPQTFRRVGDVVVAEIALDERRAGDPQALSGILAFGDGAGVRFVAAPGAVPSGGEVIAGPATAPIPPLWTLVLGALVGGLLLNIMPCVFPILSWKALTLARAGESEAKARAANAEVAAVRNAVSNVASHSNSGTPVATSASTLNAITVGSPRAGLPGWPLTYLKL